MENLKPTTEDVVKYLTSRTNDRTFTVVDGVIYEQFEGSEPFQYGFMEEVYWMEDGKIGARGYALWPFDNHSKTKTPTETKTPASLKITAPATPQVGSKAARALTIVKANPTASTKELIALVMEACSMSEQGARTYVYNARKACGS